ncbi:MAG: OB-fold nucleic acid binding domain-containing protein [Acidobacteriota bacterium]|nr:OB-fold nucleic acid binding domain-containing protein [Acidobacteriota bacterium]
MGEGAVDAILAARERVGRFESLDQFCSEVDRRALNRKVLEALVKAGSFDEFGERARLFAAIEGALERGARMAEDRSRGQAALFGGDSGAQPEAPPLPEVAPWSDRERLAGEKEALGFFLSGHPLDAHRERMREVTSHDIRSLVEGPVRIGGLITALRRRRTRAGEWMAVFTLEDTTGHVGCVVFPKLYKEIGERLEEEQAVVVKGRFDNADGDSRVFVENLVPLEQAPAVRIEGLTLRIDPERADKALLEKLAFLMASRPGPAPVYFELIRPGEYKVVLEVDEQRRVAAGRELLAELAEVLGPSAVRMGRPT